MSKKNKNYSRFGLEMMKRCFKLAKKGSGFTAPNPMVGAVIVKNDTIISEGYHQIFGGPHAEVNAVNNANEDLEGAHIYINLEPCSYHGKTPPCSLLLIKHKFAKVFISNLDPNPLIAGKGVEALRLAGIDVQTGILEEEGSVLNEKFFHFITKKTPFIALKTATSIDGKIATYSGESQWISNSKSRSYVHQLRQEYSAILVGKNTVLNDNPALTVRTQEKFKNPIRVIIDTNLKSPLNYKVFNDDAQVVIACSNHAPKEKITHLEEQEHITVLICPILNGLIDLDYVFYELGKMDIDSILIEGGGEINFNILKNKLAHKIYAFIAPMIIGGKESKVSFGGKGFESLDSSPKIKDITYSHFESDLLMEGYF